MNIHELFDDDGAVSPVIGVILMVAITVILAAVIATFVLGLGDQVSDTAPQSSFDFDFEEGTISSGATDDLGNGDNANNLQDSKEGNLTITHTGGATIDAGQLGVVGHASNSSEQKWDAGSKYGSQSEINAGSDLVVFINNDDTVRVTWENSQGSSTATLQEFEGPES